MFLHISSFISSQNFNIGDTIFYNKRKVTTKKNADYYAIINEKKNINNTNFNFVSGYKYVKDSAKFILKSKYSLKEFLTHQSEGTRTNYHLSGNKASEGIIENGNPIDKWTYWYKNGNKKEVRLYYKNIALKKEYKPHDIVDYWNENGEHTIIKGNGFFDYKNDSTSRKGYYKDGKKTGEWIGFKKQKKYFEENYKKGKLTSGISWDKDGNEYNYKKIRTNPTYKNGFTGLKKHIMKHYKIPESAKRDKIEGRTIVSFRILKNGDVDKIKMLRSLSDDYDKEAIRIIKSMDKWTPGTIRGQKIKVNYSLPLTYKLE